MIFCGLTAWAIAWRTGTSFIVSWDWLMPMYPSDAAGAIWTFSFGFLRNCQDP